MKQITPLELKIAEIRAYHDGARYAYRSMATVKPGESIMRVGPHNQTLEEVLCWIDFREHDCLSDAQSSAQREIEERISARSAER